MVKEGIEKEVWARGLTGLAIRQAPCQGEVCMRGKIKTSKFGDSLPDFDEMDRKQGSCQSYRRANREGRTSRNNKGRLTLWNVTG